MEEISAYGNLKNVDVVVSLYCIQKYLLSDVAIGKVKHVIEGG